MRRHRAWRARAPVPPRARLRRWNLRDASQDADDRRGEWRVAGRVDRPDASIVRPSRLRRRSASYGSRSAAPPPSTGATRAPTAERHRAEPRRGLNVSTRTTPRSRLSCAHTSRHTRRAPHDARRPTSVAPPPHPRVATDRLTDRPTDRLRPDSDPTRPATRGGPDPTRRPQWRTLNRYNQGTHTIFCARDFRRYLVWKERLVHLIDARVAAARAGGVALAAADIPGVWGGWGGAYGALGGAVT